MEPGLAFFLALVGFAAFGLFWFHVLRPMLEAFGILSPGEYSVSTISVSELDVTKADEQTEKTDNQTDPVSVPYDAIAYLRTDKTRAAIIDTLVRADWDVGAIRGALKGDNSAIGTEVAAARQRLGITPPPSRTLLVRDSGQPQREISL